jgi:hypothetical protein
MPPLSDIEPTELMEEIGAVLLKHLKVLPDVAVVLRIGDECRTLFVANLDSSFSEPADVGRLLTEMLQQALAQRRKQ